MKKVFFSMAILALAFQFAGCKKSQPKPPPECQVQQFGGSAYTYVDGAMVTIPYLFKKTFDNDGRVTAMDAYIFSMAGGHHVKTTLKYQGQTVYALNSEKANDTIMTISLNEQGRVTGAFENGFIRNVNIKYKYDFTYNAQNKLIRMATTGLSNINDVYRDTCIYDANGNIVRVGQTAYEYEVGKTAKKQFYMDVENLSTGYTGLRFLSYLGYFNEITSPANLRIISRTITLQGGAYYLNYNLGNHKLDSDGKLTFYEYTDGRQPAPIVYTCDQVLP